MFSKIWLINLFLAISTVFFGIKAYRVWSEREKAPSEIRPIRKPLPLPEKKIVMRNVPPESDYEVIVSSNPFRPDRAKLKHKQEKPEKKPEPKVDKKLLMRLKAALRQTVVYGVIITGEYKKALVTSVQGRPTKRGGRQRGPTSKRRARWIKVGDTLGEFKVDDIREGSVLLAAAGNQYQVFLYDKEKPKRRVKTKKQAKPTVVSVGASIKGRVKVDSSTAEKGASRPEVSKRKQTPKPVAKTKKAPSPGKSVAK